MTLTGAASTKAIGAVIGESLVSLFAGIAQQDRDDVFDCLLKADSVAGKVSQRENFPYWVFRYGQSLEQRGFKKLSPIIHQPQVITQASELESVTFAVIDSAGSRALARQAVSSLQAVLKGGHARHFFQSNAQRSELARFQLLPCLAGHDNQLIMLVCSIQVTGYAEPPDADFWGRSRREMVLRIIGGAYRFDRTVYARMRDAVRRELGDAARNAIRTFSI